MFFNNNYTANKKSNSLSLVCKPDVGETGENWDRGELGHVE